MDSKLPTFMQAKTLERLASGLRASEFEYDISGCWQNGWVQPICTGCGWAITGEGQAALHRWRRAHEKKVE